MSKWDACASAVSEAVAANEMARIEHRAATAAVCSLLDSVFQSRLPLHSDLRVDVHVPPWMDELRLHMSRSVWLLMRPRRSNLSREVLMSTVPNDDDIRRVSTLLRGVMPRVGRFHGTAIQSLDEWLRVDSDGSVSKHSFAECVVGASDREQSIPFVCAVPRHLRDASCHTAGLLAQSTATISMEHDRRLRKGNVMMAIPKQDTAGTVVFNDRDAGVDRRLALFVPYTPSITIPWLLSRCQTATGAQVVTGVSDPNQCVGWLLRFFDDGDTLQAFAKGLHGGSLGAAATEWSSATLEGADNSDTSLFDDHSLRDGSPTRAFSPSTSVAPLLGHRGAVHAELVLAPSLTNKIDSGGRMTIHAAALQSPHWMRMQWVMVIDDDCCGAFPGLSLNPLERMRAPLFLQLAMAAEVARGHLVRRLVAQCGSCDGNLMAAIRGMVEGVSVLWELWWQAALSHRWWRDDPVGTVVMRLMCMYGLLTVRTLLDDGSTVRALASPWMAVKGSGLIGERAAAASQSRVAWFLFCEVVGFYGWMGYVDALAFRRHAKTPPRLLYRDTYFHWGTEAVQFAANDHTSRSSMHDRTEMMVFQVENNFSLGIPWFRGDVRTLFHSLARLYRHVRQASMEDGELDGPSTVMLLSTLDNMGGVAMQRYARCASTDCTRTAVSANQLCHTCHKKHVAAATLVLTQLKRISAVGELISRVRGLRLLNLGLRLGAASRKASSAKPSTVAIPSPATKY